jgi:hypothetical protein
MLSSFLMVVSDVVNVGVEAIASETGCCSIAQGKRNRRRRDFHLTQDRLHLLLLIEAAAQGRMAQLASGVQVRKEELERWHPWNCQGEAQSSERSEAQPLLIHPGKEE